MCCSHIVLIREIQVNNYSHLFNKGGGWNKRGGGAKVAKSLNVEVGINVEGRTFWKILVHNSNKPGVEGLVLGKNILDEDHFTVPKF